MNSRDEVITFRSEADMPPMPASLGTTLYNKTGSWRYMRPFYLDKTPPCSHNCPAGEDISLQISLIAQGRFEEALELIRLENPFPGVTGRVCPHPCETECNRAEYGGRVAIHDLERFVADHVAPKRPSVQASQRRDAKVAIIGSGPAGLTCAYHLARWGYPVTVFEALPVPGGMMRVGIPDYRLPKDVLEREIAAIEALGVEIKTNMRLGDNLSLDDLGDYKAIFIAVGLSKSRRLNIPGEEARGVIPGLEFLKRLNLGEEVQVGSRVVVVGGGNTAMDAARSALRLGAKVTVLYRRSRQEMPAIPEEVEEALEEGVDIQFLATPVEVLTHDGQVVGLRCVRMRLGEPDESGRRRPIPIEGSEFTVQADAVIPAIGQVADLSFLDEQVKVERGRIVIDRAGATTRPGIFAGGDVATPFGTVAHAIGSGKRAAMAIDRYLRGEELPSFPPFEESVRFSPRPVESEIVRFEDLNLAYFEWAERRESAVRPPEERVKDFDEVALGLDEEQALAEASRCFNCGTCIMCDNCLNFCPDVAISRKNGSGPVSYPFYEINYDYCKGCGICAEECPRDAISLEEETKWRK